MATNLRAWQADGVLTKFTTAFSRDQEHKIYVQHRMLENAAELYDWLENGAIFYVCGDAARMAKDVDTALHQIVEQVGSKSTEAGQGVRRRPEERKTLPQGRLLIRCALSGQSGISWLTRKEVPQKRGHSLQSSRGISFFVIRTFAA